MAASAFRVKNAVTLPAALGNNVMNNLFLSLIEMLEKGETVAMATILSHAGSTPRTAGAKMMIRRDHSIAGTIGGGLVEARVIQESVPLITINTTVIRDFKLNSDLKDGLDMVCGGALTVLIETIGPDRLDFYQDLIQELSSGRACSRLVELNPDGRDGFTANHGLVKASGEITGNAHLPESPGLDFSKSFLNQPFPTLILLGDRRLILEPLQSGKTLYIFGGGHVSLCLARVAAVLDMSIVIVDDRKEFANQERFPMADRVHAVDSIPDFFGGESMDEDSFVVIVTRGHLHDQEVLADALKTNAGYIGMIGSRRKRDQIYKNLLANGVCQTDLDRVYSPIGLDINAETPAEIAVSIAAELISVKNRKTD